MFFWQTFKRYFNIAYRPVKAGMGYEELPTGGTMKAIIESMSAVLVLYASYSELSDKLLNTFSLDRSNYAPIIVSLVTCVLGIVVCLYILFSTKTDNPKIFAYSGIPRILSGIIIWLVLGSLVMTIIDFLHYTPTSLGSNEGYYELPAKACERELNSVEGEDTVRTYICRLNIPDDYRNRFKDLKVFIVPNHNFILKNVSPTAKENKVIQQGQEPLEDGKFEQLRSEWLFREFDPSNEWKLLVVVGTSTEQVKFSDEPPIKATVYFYR